jgi:Rps23 Pro-64 3,4-dihydroxylase Tpa1-like proline 4-hydroxylase
VDNTLGIRGSTQDDARKLTFILYLNDEKYVDGGELRLVLSEHEIRDIPPVGGRVVVFWSDEIPHEVLPSAPHVSNENADYDRYALTVWIPETDPRNIQPPGSKFSQLRQLVF